MALDFETLALDTIQSQYSCSTRLIALIKDFASRIAPTSDVTLFYEKIFDISTAQGIGLDIWARIVGIPSRYVEGSDTGEFFGFTGSDLSPFDQAPFWNENSTPSHYIADDMFRTLILFKALANISNASAATLNSLMAYVIGDNNSHVAIVDVMEVRFVIGSDITDAMMSTLYHYATYILGSGVKWSIARIPISDTFGFNGSGFTGFNQGVFNPYTIASPL